MIASLFKLSDLHTSRKFRVIRMRIQRGSGQFFARHFGAVPQEWDLHPPWQLLSRAPLFEEWIEVSLREQRPEIKEARKRVEMASKK